MTAKKAPKAKAKAPAPLTYAKVGGPPKNWHKLEVLGPDGVTPMRDCIEVNTVEGWCIRCVRGDDGRLLTNYGAIVHERIEGEFVIREAGK
jgi:hypothetical protein